MLIVLASNIISRVLEPVIHTSSGIDKEEKEKQKVIKKEEKLKVELCSSNLN